MIMEAGNSRTYGASGPVLVQGPEAAVEPGRANVPVWKVSDRNYQCSSLKAVRQENCLLPRGGSAFCSS